MKRAKILSASAGSGKTYQLAYKYVRDVVEHPEMYRAILAVTFTNKATEEMKSRILREIHLLASGCKSPYVEKLCAELQLTESMVRKQAMRARTSILHDYSRFSVLTIDKFFQRIIRAFIKELGIDLNYNIELDPTQLLVRGADNLVENIADNEELKRWMLEFAEERLSDGDRWDMRGDLRSLGREIFKEGSRERMKMRKSKAELNDIVSRATARAEAAKSSIKAMGERGVQIMAECGVGADMFKGASRSFVFKFAKYAEGEFFAPNATMLKAAESIDEWYGKGAGAAVHDAAQRLQPLLAELCQSYAKTEKLVNTATLLRDNYRSFALLADLYEQVTKICEEENIMILGETKHILSTFVDGSNAPFIYEKVGNRYERFMIDEFQDTSVREWNNMLPLLQNAMAESDQCSVLIVGDVKQSIYRWRGGDWRLLQEVAHRDLGENNVEVEPLKENYRSLERVVSFNNEMIDRVVEIDNQYLNNIIDEALNSRRISKSLHASLYDVMSSAYRNHRQTPGRKYRDEGYAELTLYDSTIIDSPFIEVIEDVISRGYRFSDILILVRGSNDGRKVAEQLFRYKEERYASRGEVGFNILTADALTVENCDVADFVIAVMRLTIDVDNRIERGVYNRFLGKRYDHMFDDEELAFLSHIAHLSPLEAFEQIVMRYSLYERKDRIAYIQALHEGVYSFSTSRIADIARYLEWWDERGHSETLSVDMTADTIEISTIHKAKGLERAVVIVPYCKWDTAPKGSLQTVVWSQAASDELSEIGEFPVTYGSSMQNSEFTPDYYSELVMSHVDGVNLLYVAMTRASKELYMIAPTRLNTKSKSSETINNIVPLLSRAVTGVVAEAETYNGEEGVERMVYRYGTKIQCEISSDKLDKERNIILDSYTAHTPELKIRYPNHRFTDEGLKFSSSNRRQGVRLHKLFEQAKSIEDIYDALGQMTAQSLISDSEALRLRESIERAMSNVQVQEWFSGEWDDIKNEADIITRDSMRRPDRVMIRGRRAVVVDYKFGDNVEQRYCKQVAEYISLLRDMELYDNIEGYVWYILRGEVVKVGE